MADSREAQFPQDTIDVLESTGWLVGESNGYDRTAALYTQDVIDYFQTAHPQAWEKFQKNNSRDPEAALINAVTRNIQKKGTLDTLRHGFKVPGVKVELCSFKPDHGMNPDTERRYQANRLRVVPEVSYSPHAVEGRYNPRLDLVLFVNGLPVATLELKSEFKQSVENAKRQYRRDRPLRAPTNRKPEPLLQFKSGALVHFAVSQDEVAMTTQLDGKDTFFLPFNRGTEEGGAGNPAPEDGKYSTSYLWEQVFQPDAWLKIMGRFLHLQVEEKEDFHGKKYKKETMIFPRYHQWDVVNQLLDATREEGPGKRYLVQHSAGSGKSNSIAWTAHQLASLYDDEGERLFDSVVVVTDRTVLDNQLQDTIYQFEHAHGVVERISRDIGNLSKSQQLAEALKKRARIIIVTIQTFPALFEILDEHPELQAGRFAVIADEAHSSQTGSAATKLKAILGADRPEGEEISAEELLDAAVQSRKPSESISYYAFTATPKAKTLELFGRPPKPDMPPDSDNLPEPFHLYSMRQAIEEGFILDVLKRYTTYKTAWKLAHPDGDDKEVDSRKASATLAKWVRLHPHNINQRVEVIVEHFRDNVRHLLDGQAKAMVVTGSRQEAVRYTLELRKYIEEKGYNDVHPLVAFSGSVPPDDVIPQEVTETSSLLNPELKGRDHADAFDTQDYNVMIVANKFQTGFDQPKLCAMYVDKKLQGVDCVQTLSRLNRIFPGKETFILDFFNEAEDTLAAFKPYYNKAELENVSDPQVVYEIFDKLDASGIYHWDEVEHFAEAFFDPKAPASKLSAYCYQAKNRFAKRYRYVLENTQQWRREKKEAERQGNKQGIARAEQELKDLGKTRDELDLFKKNLQSFIRAYEFLSQIIEYDDPELEKLCVFAKHLHPLLRIDRLDEEDVDVSELALTHYRLNKRKEYEINLADGDSERLKPLSDVGSAKPFDPEKKRLSEIIEKLNDLFGADIDDQDKLNFAHGIADRMRRDEDVMAQVSNEPEDKIMHGLFPKRLTDILLDSMQDNEEMVMEALENDLTRQEFGKLILRLIMSSER